MLHVTAQAAGRSCIYSLQHPSSSGRKMWHLLVCTRNDYVYLSIFNISGKNCKALFFFFLLSLALFLPDILGQSFLPRGPLLVLISFFLHIIKSTIGSKLHSQS